jgi:hypothetical protein
LGASISEGGRAFFFGGSSGGELSFIKKRQLQFLDKTSH